MASAASKNSPLAPAARLSEPELPSPSPAPVQSVAGRAVRDSAPTLAQEPRSPFAADAGSAPGAAEPSSALAGAFSAAVQSSEAEGGAGHGDEWFVGINGVPVGPIKLAELRSKAAAGAVTSESLVWRDGFEEWKPLGTFPELVAIVEEGTSSGRASHEPFDPQEDATVLAATVPRSLLVQAGVQSAEPSPAAAPAAAGPVVPVEDMDELARAAGLSRKSGLSVAQIFAMVVAILFGLTVGFVVFSGTEKTKEVVKYVKVPSESDPKPDKTPEQSEPKAENTEEETPDETTKSKSGGVAKSGKTSAGATEKKEGLKGLSGLSGLAAGPSNGPSGNQATHSNSGRPLDSAAVQSTVRRYTSSVKRSCWQPALDTRDADAPTSARVAVTITVAPSGSVQGVSTSGDPRGYRGLANCIARRVRGWQFPASSGQTTVNVPFVFAAQ